ncbi:MAG: ubiquinone/menaquinone biosynthesis methyltransferase [Planctomycetota bacterium]
MPPSVRTPRSDSRSPTPGAPESARVRSMFDGIAHRYDLLNHLLSFQMDRLWRRRAALAATRGLVRPRVLDLCAGTGDLARAVLDVAKSGSVFAADFSLEMLARAARKDQRLRLAGADALKLPFRAGSFDVVTAAFGVRNFSDRAAGFSEIRRVLRPGGRFVMLEFTPPGPGFVGSACRFYSRTVLPRVGAFLSRDPAAYRYLPESVDRFPGAEDLRGELMRAGFRRVDFERFAFGTVALHCASLDG